MTRIIAGSAGGRRLQVPAKGTRPTSDRVREALFSTIESDLLASDETWAHGVVLDLYAGSGALGLEALSRGAAAVILVEKSSSAARVLQANIDAVGLPGARLVIGDAAHLPPGDHEAMLVFADPPYDVSGPEVQEVLSRLAATGWIAGDAMVVVERSARDDASPLPDTWTVDRRRLYGDTVLWYGRVVG
jgi:16S rRNA (guanine966-N2)-methyltransferase